MFNERKNRTSSILIQLLNTENRLRQPIMFLIIPVTIILDAARIILNTILCLLVILCFSGITVAIILGIKLKPEYDTYMQSADKTVSETTPDTFRYNETTILYYSNGKKMSELKRDTDTVYLMYDDIPKNVVNAFVAVEDRTFWDNPGVDIKGIARGVYDAVVSRGERLHGASTITQQLARCIFLNNGVTIDRKLQEMAISIKLTEKYTKEQIMEFYVNNIYYANGCYGIEAAAQGYFSKPVAELTLSETAYLCAIPNSPTFFDPYNDPERALDRRDHILDSMHDVGFISWNATEEAKKEEVKIKPPSETAGGYEVTYTADCAIRYFMELDGFHFQYHFDTIAERNKYKESYNSEYEKMREELYQGGYSVYTTIDSNIQEALQENVDGFINALRSDKAPDLQAAMVLTDEKARVCAIVGGTKEGSRAYGLNRAYQSFRQPGSAIKPLVDYTPALEEGYTADTLVKNISIAEVHKKEKERINNGISYEVKNLPGSMVTLRQGLEKSLNGVAYVLMNDLGVENTVPFLENLHFSAIVPDDYTFSASLGGLTYGASSVEMCSGYACLANAGLYNEPTCISGITDRYGNELYKGKSEERIYTGEAVAGIKDMLEGVMVCGTGSSLGWYSHTDVKAYVKTGTTNNQKDGWMCGWSEDEKGKQRVMSVWVGCDIPKALSELWGNTWPGKLWMESMLDVIQNQ